MINHGIAMALVFSNSGSFGGINSSNPWRKLISVDILRTSHILTYLWNVQLFLVKSLNSKTRSFEDFGKSLVGGTNLPVSQRFNHGNPVRFFRRPWLSPGQRPQRSPIWRSQHAHQKPFVLLFIRGEKRGWEPNIMGI